MRGKRVKQLKKKYISTGIREFDSSKFRPIKKRYTRHLINKDLKEIK